jgi:hypothetical protein
MPQTFDLSEASKGGPPQPPAPPPSKGRGTGLPIDDYARTLLYISLAVTGVCLLYTLWGLFGGAWANPAYQALGHADRLRHLSNIGSVGTVLSVASIIDVVCLAICCFRDEGVGYLLLAVAAVLYAGMSYITGAVLNARGMQPSPATSTAIGMLARLASIYLVPGVLFVLVDFVRRLKAMSEAAAVQRANVRYGAEVKKQSGQRNLFLGRCWELPYCREQVRQKCPIYIKRQGPCWWYKEGCMCEERIVLQAVIDTDWRDKTNAAVNKAGGAAASPMSAGKHGGLAGAPGGLAGSPMSLGAPSPVPAAAGPRLNLNSASSKPEARGLGINAPPKQVLTAGQKRERCRNCIIYNEHQRQKYKGLVWVALIVVPVLLWMNMGWLGTTVTAMITFAAKFTAQFNLSTGPSAAANTMMESQNINMVMYVMIFCLGLVIVSQVLKFIEFCCFKLKI